MEDNIRTVRNSRKMTPEEIEDVRKRALVGSATALADYTDKVLFGDVWERPGPPLAAPHPKDTGQRLAAPL